jgi:hypothetical protein
VNAWAVPLPPDHDRIVAGTYLAARRSPAAACALRMPRRATWAPCWASFAGGLRD